MKSSTQAVAIAAACFLLTPACKKQATPATPAPSVDGDPAPITHTYSTRGIIEALPEPGKPASELMIRHEAINDFVNNKGEVVGMNAMTMPFPKLANGVTLEGLAVGDKVAFTFTNTWSGPAAARRSGWIVDSVSKLPSDTELVFGQKIPPTPAPAQTEHK